MRLFFRSRKINLKIAFHSNSHYYWKWASAPNDHSDSWLKAVLTPDGELRLRQRLRLRVDSWLGLSLSVFLKEKQKFPSSGERKVARMNSKGGRLELSTLLKLIKFCSRIFSRVKCDFEFRELEWDGIKNFSELFEIGYEINPCLGSVFQTNLVWSIWSIKLVYSSFLSEKTEKFSFLKSRSNFFSTRMKIFFLREASLSKNVKIVSETATPPPLLIFENLVLFLMERRELFGSSLTQDKKNIVFSSIIFPFYFLLVRPLFCPWRWEREKLSLFFPG